MRFFLSLKLPNLAHIEHAPSIETMHGPYGRSGLHVFINNGHSTGLIIPNVTSPHLQPGGRSFPEFLLFGR